MEKWRSRWELVVQDTAPESLLNELTAQNVRFSGTQRLDPVTLFLEVRYGEISQVRQVLDRRGSDLRMCRPKGSRPMLLRLLRRRVLLGCLLAWLVALSVSNLFVWRMDVIGAETVPVGVILRTLTDAGAGIGSFWPGFDSEALRNRLLLEVPELQWAGINYKSGVVEIVVRERREPPKVIDNDEPVHITAARSGVITEISAKQGQRLVSAGDTVAEGEVLISGAAQSTLGTVRTVHALGSVTARTWHTITARQPAVQTEKRYTGETSRRFSMIFGKKRINFYSDSSISHGSCDKIIKDYHLCLEGVFALPIHIVAEQRVYWTPECRELSAAVQEETARKALMKILERRLDGVGVAVNCDFAAAFRSGGMTVTVQAECTEEIGRETPLTEAELRQINTIREEPVND